MNNTGIYKGLLEQLSRLYRHNRQNAYKTRERYHQGMQRFCRYIASEFRLQKLANIAPKHIKAYVLNMQERGLAASTIKTELSAIRFWFDQIPNPRHKLPPNSELNLERRSFGETDRAWSDNEYDGMIRVCKEHGREDYIAALTLARYVGLRIHEVHKVDTAIARDAIRKMEISTKGKGGRVRSIPASENVKVELEKMLAVTNRGNKMFVPNNVPTHVAIKDIQDFIREHRDEVQEPNADPELTFHGLRYNYAQEAYLALISKGYSDHNACKQVSQWLGHERAEITRIYLAGLKDGDGHV